MLNNKKAVFPALAAIVGVLGAVGTIIVLILSIGSIASLIIWVTKNWNYLLGGSILLLTLILGLPKLLSSPDKPRIIVVVFFTMVGVLTISVPFVINNYNFNNMITKQTYYDKDFGFVKYELINCNWLCRIGKFFSFQNFDIDKSTYKLNDIVAINGYISCPSEKVTRHYYQVTNPKGQLFTFDFTVPPTLSQTAGALTRSSAQLQVVNVGKYEIKDFMYCTNRVLPIGPMNTKTFDVIQQITECQADYLIDRFSPVNINKPTGVSDYYCNKWAKFTLSNNNCVKSEYCKNYHTYCASGYVIEGTQNQQAFELNNYASCVKQVVAPPTPVCNAPCNDNIYCSDKKTILNKCINSCLEATSNTCPPDVVNPPVNTECTESELGYNKCSDGKTIVSWKCENGKKINTNLACEDGTIPPPIVPPNSSGIIDEPLTDNNYVVPLLIGLGVLIFIFIIVLIIIRRQ